MNSAQFLKQYFLLLIAIYILTACSGVRSAPATILTPIGVGTSLPHASQTPTISRNTQNVWPTPVITATPLVPRTRTDEEVKTFVDQLYKIDPQCRLDILNTTDIPLQKPILTFQKSDLSINTEKLWVSEIADNSSKTLRAFVACDPHFCQQKLFVEDQNSGVVQEIKWEGQTLSRPISRIAWIGDNLLSFSHSTNPDDAVIATVDTRKEKFLFYWLVHYPCQ